jgi:DNA-binding NtrC family response regulator
MSNGAHKSTVLIVDDERNFTESLKLAIEDAYDISDAGSLSRAREILKINMPDAILLDVRLPDGEGIELIRELKDSGRMPVIIVMTAHATVENAVSAMKEGSVDYFTKPLDIDRLKRVLKIYLENRVLQQKINSLDSEIKKIVPPFVTAGKDAMKTIIEQVPAVAPLLIPICIQGETGTGKERLAQWIHELSGLQGELVTLSCATLPRDIFESELFGYVKGAFSGAAVAKEGFIEKADGGTLFLDEIGELSDDTQAKLLRVLESGHYFKLGDTRERTSRFRLITATHKNLIDPANRFRQDLFYRINGMAFELPRLRDRAEDIPLLSTAFLREANHAFNRDVKGISEPAMSALNNYDWPGNIRELKWCIHRAVAIAAKHILDVDDFAIVQPVQNDIPDKTAHESAVTLNDAVEEVEKRLIRNILASTGNNKTEAAKILGISARQLHYKIKQYSI